MKRKTNLFYLSGDDSNFLTFSNYAENLTGTILSTDNKIFPSKFLCFYINTENINVTDGELIGKSPYEIIKIYLISYYENKLAILRDYCIDNNIKIEENIKPLNYLLETFLKIEKETGIKINLVYLGEITEQDYNGIYNDMICTIDSNNLKRGEIKFKETDENTLNEDLIVTLNDIQDSNNYNLVDLNHLYGWYSASEVEDETLESNLPNSEYDLEPRFDFLEINNDEKTAKYYIESSLSEIDFSKETESYDSIKFNLVVPLYDIVDINYQNNFIEQDENIKSIDLNRNSDLYNYNIPYGIWFATDVIELNRDEETNIGPSWSLVLSSQFKPFPYSNVMPNELEISKKPDAYYTFAQILARQNEILDEFNKLNNSIVDINKRLLTLETKVNTFGTSYTTDILNKNMMVWEKEMLDKYNNLENTLYTYLDNLNWKFRNG